MVFACLRGGAGVSDDITILRWAVDGNTEKINDIAKSQVEQGKSLAASIKANHKKVVAAIDGMVDGHGR